MDEQKEIIELINRLQSYFRSTGCKVDIELPQIVVVGAQSSGKSSVLEGLIGASILPRGSGTVTKCPIIIQLVHTTNPDEEGVEFEGGEEHGKVTDYDVVRRIISEKMNENNGTISDIPIIIRVYSPNVVTLTVVDLPGVKRLTSSGEPSDLEQLILKLCRKYIHEKNTIILAVSPANYDICNSDGLLLAREADPDGKRTIGVLTKLDLMDKGTNARDLITGTSKDIRLELGMIGIVNRSQDDINNNHTIESQLEKEKQFLEEHYPDLAEINGTRYLRKRLQELLIKKIHACLPEFLNELDAKLEVCNERLSRIPSVMNMKEKRMLANKMIKEFEGNIKKEIEGSIRNPELKYVYGGIEIRNVFKKHFPNEMNQARQASISTITDEMVINALNNCGSYNSFFDYPEPVFTTLAEKQVACIEKPALKCAKRVYDVILAISTRHTNTETLKHFPQLKNSMQTVVVKMIEDNLKHVENRIKEYIGLQSRNPFSLDSTFLNKLSDLKHSLEKVLNGNKTEGVSDVKPVFPISLNFGPGVSLQNNGPQPQSNGFNAAPNVNVNNIHSGFDKTRVIHLIKSMANLYYDHIHVHCLDFIPKLIADKLITQFSTDGTLGDELRTEILENLEELLKLPANVQEQLIRESEKKMHLQKVKSQVKNVFDLCVTY